MPPIPRQRRPEPDLLFTTTELAAYLHCSAAMVRLLVSRGVLEPYDRVPSYRGRPTMRFDVAAVLGRLADTPELAEKFRSLTERARECTFSPPLPCPDSG